MFGPLLEVKMLEKVAKHLGFGRLLEVQRWKKCTPLWPETHFEVNNVKTPGVRTTFGRFDGSRKSARRCGAKHIWKSKVLKIAGFEPLLRCQMSFC